MLSQSKQKSGDIFTTVNRRNLVKYLVPIIALSISILLIPLTMLPLWDSIGVLTAQKQTDLELLAQLNTKQDQIAAVRKDIASYKDQFTRLDTAYPTAKDVPALVLAVSRMAEENGLILDSYRLNPGEVIATPGAKAAATVSAAPIATGSGATVPEAVTPPPIIPTNSGIVNPKDGILFEVVTRGTLPSLRDFVKQVSEIRRVLYISSVSLVLKKEEYAAKTIIEVPYNGLPETLLSAEEPLPQVSAQVKALLATLEAFPLYTGPLPF